MTGLWMRSCAACKASVPPESLLFSLQISRHLKVGILCLRVIYSPESGLIATATVGDLKVLILGGLDGRGRAALRLHECPDNDEDGCLWRMRSQDEAVLGAVKQTLAG
jgi:hypothetical protein